jgi:hypothetical protein
VQISLDADVLAWFKAYGKGYQSRINAVLRDVMPYKICRGRYRTKPVRRKRFHRTLWAKKAVT